MTNLEHSLLKNCLNNEFYEANRSKLRPELFNETLKEIYTSIVEMHDKFAKDITSLDLFAYLLRYNAVNSCGSGAAKRQEQNIKKAPEEAFSTCPTFWRRKAFKEQQNPHGGFAPKLSA